MTVNQNRWDSRVLRSSAYSTNLEARKRMCTRTDLLSASVLQGGWQQHECHPSGHVLAQDAVRLGSVRAFV